MSDLVTFLSARLDEDAARATMREWHATDCSWVPDSAGYTYPCDCGVPERVLADVEAKRRIVEECAPADLFAGLPENELHERRVHPDFEYLTVETGRKSGEDDSPPDGEGWEPNDFIDMGTAPDGTPYPRRNWERFDYTEETYYRRRRATPRQAPPDPLTLRLLALPYADHADYDPSWRV